MAMKRQGSNDKRPARARSGGSVYCPKGKVLWPHPDPELNKEPAPSAAIRSRSRGRRPPSADVLSQRLARSNSAPNVASARATLRRPSAEPGLKLWQTAQHHAVHALNGAEWWDVSGPWLQAQKAEAEKAAASRRPWRQQPGDQKGAEEGLPDYHGWPSAGPSQDPMLLKMRQSRLHGHVDWVTWTQEARPSSPSRPSSFSVAPARLAEWCSNYGVAKEDGTIFWPPPTLEPETVEAASVSHAPGQSVPVSPASAVAASTAGAAAALAENELDVRLGLLSSTGRGMEATFGPRSSLLLGPEVDTMSRHSHQLLSPGSQSQRSFRSLHHLPQSPTSMRGASAVVSCAGVSAAPSEVGVEDIRLLNQQTLQPQHHVEDFTPERVNFGTVCWDMEKLVESFLVHEDKGSEVPSTVQVQEDSLQPQEPEEALEFTCLPVAPEWQRRSHRLDELRRKMRGTTEALGEKTGLGVSS